MDELINKLKFNEQGLLPAVAQDVDTKEVLMVAYMNRESIAQTLETGKACFWSRSRQELWLKGETSGNYLLIEEIMLDCDNDTLLLMVKPKGPACHTGNTSCFYRRVENGKINPAGRGDSELVLILQELYNLISQRRVEPVEGSYTNYLLDEGIDKVCKKVGEEAAEVIIGAKNESQREIIYESADLLYHLLVLLNINNISLEKVLEELKNRRK